MAIATSVAITKDNYFTQIHANIFNLINNRSNIPLPDGLPSAHKFVYVREPNYLSRNFDGFPFIIVPDPEVSQDKKTADATKAFQSETFEIVVMTSDKNSDSDGNPVGTQQMRDICTNIVKTLNDITNSKTLRNNGLRNKEFPSITLDCGELDEKPIFRREFSLRFSNQLRVIS